MKIGDMMKVEVNGVIELRRVESISTITFSDGTEITTHYNPELNAGEGVSYTMGMPPVISKITN